MVCLASKPKPKPNALFAIACCIGLVISMARPLVVSATEAAPTVVYIPLDSRPVSLQLPQMLANIAGIQLLTPPPRMLGSYLQAGDTDALGAWLTQQSPIARNFVVSTDMLAYGSLVASRLPGIHAGTAIRRLAPLAALRRRAPYADIAAFGTIMRLAPTGLPTVGDAASYFSAGRASVDVTAYANLPSPPRSDADRDVAALLRRELGPTLTAYLQARRRNLRVDRYLLDIAARGKLDRLVLGQDDAGPVGLHLADIAALRAHLRALHLDADQASIEPGADELGMALLARSLSHAIHWTPRISVTYSRPGAQQVHDRIEYQPIDPTIGKVIRLCGGVRVGNDQQPDINLYVYVAQTKPEERDAFLASLQLTTKLHRSVAVADLSFINGALAQQSELIEALIQRGMAAQLDGYGSWNTDANSVGTALAAAVFTEVGRRTGRLNANAHATFLLDRYADDYAYRLLVRTRLNDVLQNEHIAQTYLLPGSAMRMESDARALLWQQLISLRDRVFPQYALCRATITLPWQRTFETKLMIELQPKSPAVETQSNGGTSCRFGIPAP